jgi:hypothetical protein
LFPKDGQRGDSLYEPLGSHPNQTLETFHGRYEVPTQSANIFLRHFLDASVFEVDDNAWHYHSRQLLHIPVRQPYTAVRSDLAN